MPPHSRILLIAWVTLGCDVYDPSLLERFIPDGGCRRGTADCDLNGSCESELASAASCGACGVSCVGAEVCNPGTLRCEGDAGVFDGAVPDTGGIDAAPPDAGPVICGTPHPSRPVGSDRDDTATRTYALRDILVDQRGDLWEELGWNLDERCSLALTDEPACIPPEADRGPLDGSGGVDNVFGQRVLRQLADINPSFQQDMRAAMLEGRTNIIRLAGWNGTDNDPRVEVFVAEAAGHVRLDGADAPQWDGNDRWNVADVSFVGGNPDRPIALDDNAYVVNRRLVAQIPDRQPFLIPWVGRSTRFEVTLTQGRISARISNDGNALEDFTLSGRFGDSDLEDNWIRFGSCDAESLRRALELQFGALYDLRSAPGSGGPSVDCDAMSVAIGFTGVAALYGEVVEALPDDSMTCP